MRVFESALEEGQAGGKEGGGSTGAGLGDVVRVAKALESKPNYWLPKDVIVAASRAGRAEEEEEQQGQQQDKATELMLAEGMVCRLYQLLKEELEELEWSGAEYWAQVYRKGRGLEFHFDKDEHVMAEQGKMENPILSSVLYLTGREGRQVQSPTIVTNQYYSHDKNKVVPEDPTESTFVFPKVNRYCVFDGRLAHGLLDSGCEDVRVTFLVNWWKKKPESVDRAQSGDIIVDSKEREEDEDANAMASLMEKKMTLLDQGGSASSQVGDGVVDVRADPSDFGEPVLVRFRVSTEQCGVQMVMIVLFALLHRWTISSNIMDTRSPNWVGCLLRCDYITRALCFVPLKWEMKRCISMERW